MYAFRNTYKLDQDTFVEDRGAPFYVRRGDELFNTLLQKFPELPVGYNAKRGSEGDYWEYEAGWPALEEAKSAKLAEIKQAYHDAEEHGYTTSSLGFVVDATRRSISDVNGLIQLMEDEGLTSDTFRDYHNEYHVVSLEQAKLIKLEIIKAGRAVYARKWELETAVDAAETPEAVKAIHW